MSELPDPVNDRPLPPPHRERYSQDLLGEISQDQDRMMRYWLAGGGFLASAAVLAAGSGREVIVLAIVLGAIGLISLIFALAQGLGRRMDKSSASRRIGDVPPRSETFDDQQWQNNESAALLSAIHDALGDIAVRRSLNGTILHSNNTFRDLVGDKAPEGKTCQELGIQFQPGIIQHSYDVELRTSVGNRVFLWHDVVARDPVLGDLIIQSIARDVTDERQTALSQEAARRRAELDSENKSRLIATVAHEIRTPLSGLLGMGNLLAQTHLAPDQANYLSGIRQSGTALIHLVEDLLDFSTIAAGRFTLRPKPEDIRTLIETIAEMLSPRAHEKGLEIGTHVDAGLPDMLVLDPARLRQVLYNVAGNAVKFTDHGGILIRARKDGPDLVLEVVDTGPGMNDAEIARIFNEFEQGDIAGAREMGVGLGLAISARILAEVGGKLSVASIVNKGTTFTIRIPVGSHGQAVNRAIMLSGSRVLVISPPGPATEGLVSTLRGLGARAGQASDLDAVLSLLTAIDPTDIIVDYRSEDLLELALASRPEMAGSGCRRILMVDPESRPTKMVGSNHDAWLIRPLRERSLVDVLLGRFQGLEHRETDNHAFPSLPAVMDEIDDHPSEPTPVYRIIVAEDDPVNALIAQASLEKAGHKVQMVASFSMLESKLATGERPDMIVSDFSMPGGQGDTFLIKLRAAETMSGLDAVPVIIVTADTSDETRRALLSAGANLVLAKPVDPKILTGAVSHLCGLRPDNG